MDQRLTWRKKGGYWGWGLGRYQSRQLWGSGLFLDGVSNTVPRGVRVFPGCRGEIFCVGSFKFILGRLGNPGLLSQKAGRPGSEKLSTGHQRVSRRSLKVARCVLWRASGSFRRVRACGFFWGGAVLGESGGIPPESTDIQTF